ncbi:hypothetical protein PHMEG_0005728 [Phytophthora megakarya]|uniref:CCHC-type domain-containing protein n=1 Tax=Phytophthora megakarya TaxID=4795 RepID=A0A225WQN9_9STRA|nr:hypothetical protein PHMEG_0005728 [Phytophthora megakarya]
MQVCFSMNERFVSVSDTCDWRLVDFTPEIIEYCSQHGVQFQESELILEVKDQQYLKGSPLRQNRELWQLMKRGYIPFQLSNESEQKIWIQPAYTGLRGSNLSLTELEYSNGNYVSPAQLRTTIQGWGGSDCLVVSHSKYMGEKQRWTPIACMRYAATSLMYSFRLFFPNEEEANTVYKNYLEFARYRQRRRDNPTDTISLRPVQNAEWDVDTASLIRMTRTEIEARTSVRVNVYGVSSEVTPTAIKQAFQRAGAQPDSITINRGRGRSAVATFQSPDQAKSMVGLFGEHGTERLHVGNIALYIAPARPGDCWNCNKSGHFKRDCPLLSNTIKTISPWRSHQPRAENHNNAQLAATNSTDTTAAEALVSRLIDSKINTVTTALTEMTRQCRTANDRCQALERKFASMEDTWDNRMSRVVELTLAKLQLITAPKEYPATMNHTHTDDDDTMGEATPTPSPISRSQQDFT